MIGIYIGLGLTSGAGGGVPVFAFTYGGQAYTFNWQAFTYGAP